MMMSRSLQASVARLACGSLLVSLLWGTASGQTLERAFVFGVQADQAYDSPNEVGRLYDIVEQIAGDPLSIAYPTRGSSSPRACSILTKIECGVTIYSIRTRPSLLDLMEEKGDPD